MNSYARLYPLLDHEHIKESVARALLRAAKDAAPYSPVAGFFRGLAKGRGATGRLDAARLGVSDARVARTTKSFRKKQKQLEREATLANAARAEREELGKLQQIASKQKRKSNRKDAPKNDAPKNDAPKKDAPKNDTSKQKGPKRTAVQGLLDSSKRVAKENPLLTAGGLGLAGLGLGYAVGDKSDGRRRMVIL
jgi:thiamine pyrophosphate-dependent acetolactate synthase large subunit-like protein